jgi:carbon-monoxide dehydrogenase small subunit
MQVQFTLNGRPVTADAHPMASLLDVLRDVLGSTGTKYGCGEGECGACTVLLAGDSVMSCMVPIVQVDGAIVETIEGLAGEGGLHPIQQAFLECGGAQCGICTPGMIMAAEYYRRHPERAPGGVAEALEGNLCRCTGYTRIFEAVQKSVGVKTSVSLGGGR